MEQLSNFMVAPYSFTIARAPGTKVQAICARSKWGVKLKHAITWLCLYQRWLMYIFHDHSLVIKVITIVIHNILRRGLQSPLMLCQPMNNIIYRAKYSIASNWPANSDGHNNQNIHRRNQPYLRVFTFADLLFLRDEVCMSCSSTTFFSCSVTFAAEYLSR